MNKKQIPTTGLGWGAIISLVAGVTQLLTDGDPTTNPDWNYVIPTMFAAFGVVFARSTKATSEDVGAKPPSGGP